MNEALYCLALTKTVGDRRLVAVLLGHPSEFGVIREAAALLDEAAPRIAGADTIVETR